MTGRAGKTNFIECIYGAGFFYLTGNRKGPCCEHGTLFHPKNMGEKMYKISRVINNNIVCSRDDSGEEIILRGLGIGFKKKTGDPVDEKTVEKVYRISNPGTKDKLQGLLAEIPLEYVEVSTDIIEYAQRSLKKKLNENIYLTLTDHISFALDRKKAGLEYKNALLSEIRSFYSREYELGLYALEIIKERLGVELSRDEAGFIALHIVNAQLDTQMSSMVAITEMIQQVLNITEVYYGRKLSEDSLDYERFVTHLKYFGQRLFNRKSVRADDDPVFQRMVRERYPSDYACAGKIRDYIEETYHLTITEEEMMFLTVHLRRVSGNS